MISSSDPPLPPLPARASPNGAPVAPAPASLDEPALATIFVDSRPTAKRLRKAKLVVTEGPDRGKELVIERERVTVGRSMISDLDLRDPAVSSSHFEITVGAHGYLLRDLDSTNGTRVADLRVKEVYLCPGVVVRAGQTTIEMLPFEGTVEIALSDRERFGDLIGQSVRMREIFATLEKVAPSDLTVLVEGETGTGKELVARAIHQNSRRADKPFVVQDCSAIPRDLVESTLFGHEKGSFTGAVDRHRGSFEAADGGTIFLDEIGELNVALQPKLLRALENREIKRVGAERTLKVDVRVLAATNRDLRAMVNEGTFREDLYYRLSVIHVIIPPLRERREDIPFLAAAFLDEFAARWPSADGPAGFRLSRDAMDRLRAYSWPGNVRELRNAMERAASLSDARELGAKDLAFGTRTARGSPGSAAGSFAAGSAGVEMPFKEAKQEVIDAFEVHYLGVLLSQHAGNITRAAEAAGLTRYHLRELLKRHGVHYTSD